MGAAINLPAGVIALTSSNLLALPQVPGRSLLSRCPGTSQQRGENHVMGNE